MYVVHPQTMMTVKFGVSVIISVRIAQVHIIAAVLMDISWSRVMSARPIFQASGK